MILLMLASDICALALAISSAILLRYIFGGQFQPMFYFERAPVVCFFIAAYAMLGLYPGILTAPHEELKKLTISTTLIFALFISTTFFLKLSTEFSRLVFLGGWLGSVILVPFCRVVVRRIFSHKPWWGIPAVIWGQAAEVEQLANRFRRDPRQGIRVLDAVSTAEKNNDDALAPLMKYAALSPQPILVCTPESRKLFFSSEAVRLEELFQRMLVMPPKALDALNIQVLDVGGVLFFQLQTKLLDPFRQRLKRTLDLLLIFCALPLLLPLMAVLAVAVKMDGGPVFYTQPRIGRHGHTFRIFKFRTMVCNADTVLQECLAQNFLLAQEWAETQKLRCDPRITKVGSFLRRTSLDELPQVINVLRGEMSLVGPRPIVQTEIRRYGDAFALYKRTLPGISGLWQISGRSSTTYEERIMLDTYYSRNWSVWIDLYVLSRTVWVVLKQSGAY